MNHEKWNTNKHYVLANDVCLLPDVIMIEYIAIAVVAFLLGFAIAKILPVEVPDENKTIEAVTLALLEKIKENKELRTRLNIYER